jgi:hypothetical protein
VPNRNAKDSFSLGLPNPNPFWATAFIDKSSPLAVRLRESLKWEGHYWATVELEWKKEGSLQWVEITAVSQATETNEVELLRLRLQREGLRVQLGAKHPTIKALDAQIQMLEKTIQLLQTSQRHKR